MDLIPTGLDKRRLSTKRRSRFTSITVNRGPLSRSTNSKGSPSVQCRTCDQQSRALQDTDLQDIGINRSSPNVLPPETLSVTFHRGANSSVDIKERRHKTTKVTHLESVESGSKRGFVQNKRQPQTFISTKL